MGKVLIVGAGAIGTLIGASFVKAGFSVTFVGRSHSNYTNKIKQLGLLLVHHSGEQTVINFDNPKVRFMDISERLEEIFEIIVVAVKSNCVNSISSYIHAHSNEFTLIFHAQNGIPYWWFTDDQYINCLGSNLAKKVQFKRYLNSVDSLGRTLDLLGDRCLIGCVVKAPCQKIESGKVKIRKKPKMLVGLANSSQSLNRQSVQTIAGLLSENSLCTTYTDNIRIEVCNKLTINIATNVLSALTGWMISDLTANQSINGLIEILISELRDLFICYGIEHQNLPTKLSVYSYIMEPGSQNHLPSLAEDFSLHKQGEVSLVSAPVEMAKLAEIEVPVLSRLEELLKFAQNYVVNSIHSEFNLLTFDLASNSFHLSESIYQLYYVDEKEISELCSHLQHLNFVMSSECLILKLN